MFQWFKGGLFLKKKRGKYVFKGVRKIFVNVKFIKKYVEAE